MSTGVTCTRPIAAFLAAISTTHLAALVATVALLAAPAAYAHKASDAYLDFRFEPARTQLRWDIALRDLHQLIDLDPDGDGAIEWGAVDARREAIVDLARGALDLSSGAQACRLAPTALQIARRNDGAYAVLRFDVDCGAPATRLSMRYRLLAAVDPTHRAIVSVAAPGAAPASSPSDGIRVVRPDDLPVPIEADASAASADRPAGWTGFTIEGIRHILGGTDHLAFVLALLIPTIAFAGRAGRALGPTTLELTKLVTLFTIAHSVTLSLTALRLVEAPSRIVESLVAISVAAAGWHAWQATRPRARHDGTHASGIAPWVVFAFGLVHGMGFGSALLSSGFAPRTALPALFGFNLGVEAGQLLVLAALFPLAWALRHSGVFLRRALPAVSLLIAGFGVVWLLERAFDVAIVTAIAQATGGVLR
ncbi:MAG: HupE/UreJ family protein [Lautropia sp.]